MGSGETLDLWLSPSEIAELLQRPCPNQEQSAVITAPIDVPIRVVAGAGSGKTETMAQRVVYLIANQLVAPEDILGLTFTTKAARELKERIDQRLQFLAQEIGKRPDEKSQKIAQHLRNCASIWDNSFMVNVSTYNAYANEVVKNYGSYLGIPRNATIIPELSAWQVVHDLVENMPAEPKVNKSLSSLTATVLKLNDDLSNHLYNVPEAISALEKLKKEFEIEKPNKDITTVIENIDLRIWCLRVLEKYQAYKREHHFIDYGDQIAIAAQLVREKPQVRKHLARQYQVVLLDEFQDTSSAQLELFSQIFAGKGVVCVGDPNQAIYSFRGASEISMKNCLAKFTTKTQPGLDFTLSISYRNGSEILEQANRVVLDIPQSKTVAEQLAENPRLSFSRLIAPKFFLEPGDSGYEQLEKDLAKGFNYDPEEFLPVEPGLKVAPLRSAEMCGSGEVKSYYGLTRLDEARQIALELAQHYYLKAELAASLQPTEEMPKFSAAILLRDRNEYQYFVQALQELGVPCEILISTALLDDPLIAEIYAVLKLINEVSDGTSLQRLLVSCGIGLRDLDLLYRYAKELAQTRAEAGTELPSSADIESTLADSEPVPGKVGTPNLNDTPEKEATAKSLEIYLYDAIETLPPIDWKPAKDQSHLPGFTPAAHYRLQRLREQLFQLRQHQHEPIDVLIEQIYTGLNLDLDLVLSSQADAHLLSYQSFKKLAESFQQEAINPSLPAFISWLEASEREGNTLKVEIPLKTPGKAKVDIGAVQILTCHGAKGLEWDIVAVPKLDRELGKEIKAPNWCSSYQEFPYSLRSDREVLPQLLNVEGYIQKEELKAAEVKKMLDRYKKALLAQAVLEHRRLMYVAFTRARQTLILSAAASNSNGIRRKPQRILLERYPEIAREARTCDFHLKALQNQGLLDKKFVESGINIKDINIDNIAESKVFFACYYPPLDSAETTTDSIFTSNNIANGAITEGAASRAGKKGSELFYLLKPEGATVEQCQQIYQEFCQKKAQEEEKDPILGGISPNLPYDYPSIQGLTPHLDPLLERALQANGYEVTDPVLIQEKEDLSQVSFWPPLPKLTDSLNPVAEQSTVTEESTGAELYRLALELEKASADPQAVAEALEILNYRSNTQAEDPWFSDARALVEVWKEQNHQDLYLPKQLAPTGISALGEVENYQKNLRRPLPFTEILGTQVGTYFHNWVDDLFKTAQTRGILAGDPGEFREYALKQTQIFNREQVEPELLKSLENLQTKWLDLSFWEEYEYIASEYPCHGSVRVGDSLVAVNGSIDAVFRHRETGKTWIIDWKTDRDTSDSSKLTKYFAQLAQYRYLYAQLNHLDIAQVEAGLCFIGQQRIAVVPEELKINTSADYQKLFTGITRS